MPHLEATIEAVSVKELAEPDRFKNTHRRSIKIGEDWYSCGSGKSDKFNVKTDNGWEEVGKGDKVEFMYRVNGDFKNVDMKTLTILAKGSPSTPPTEGKKSLPQNKDFVNPAEIGQAMNLAVNSLGYKEDDMLDAPKAIKAIQWYKRSRQLFTSLFPTVDVETTYPEEKPKTKAKKKPAPVVEDEDEI